MKGWTTLAVDAETGFGLVGDVGGTNLRLALAHRAGGRIELVAPSQVRHDGVFDLLAAIRADLAARVEPVRWACVAVAGPVRDGAVSLTNAGGGLTEAGLSQAIGGGPARLINDFAALALAAPLLGECDLHRLGGPGIRLGPETIAVLGPGTGLGVSALVRDGSGEAVAATEGGHVGFSPADEVESRVQAALTARYGRCSLERILCGPGMLALHEALGGAPFESPAALQAAATEGDAAANATLDRFALILGSAAGDFALSFGARGGVLIGGGIAPRMLARLGAGGFRARFEAKGRFESYLKAVPTCVIVHPHAALLGAEQAMLREP